MADRLDKFFKNKLSREKVPFNEELWLKAAAELDSRKRKRRMIFWIIPFAMGLSVLLAWWHGAWGNQIQEQVQERQEEPVARFFEKENKSLPELVKESVSADINNYTKLTEASITDKQIIKKGPFQNPANFNDHQSIPLYEKPENIDIKPTNQSLPIQINKGENRGDPLKIESAFTSESKESLFSKITTREVEMANQLPPVDFEFEPLENGPDENSLTPGPIIPLPSKTAFEISILSGVEFGLGANTHSFQVIRAGLIFEKYFTQKLGMGVGLNYHFRNGKFGQLDQSTGKSYDFGSETWLQTLELNGIHALEAPVFFSWRWRKNQVNAGVFARRIIGFKGRKQMHASQNSLPFSRLDSENGKLSNQMLEPGFEYGFVMQYGFRWRNIIAGFSGSSSLEVFRWTDSDGVIHGTTPYSFGIFAKYRLK